MAALLRRAAASSAATVRRLCTTTEHDVIVVGGGVVGSLSACQLATALPEQSIALVDAGTPGGSATLDAEASADLRVFAISPASAAAMESVGAWSALDQARITAYKHMQVWDGTGPGFMRFGRGAEALGWIVENRALQAVLADAVARLCGSNLSAYFGAGVEGVDFPHMAPAAAAAAVRAPRGLPPPPPLPGRGATVRLADGRALRGRLIVAADGAASATRAAGGVTTWGWDYGQRAVVATVATPPGHATAWQRFLPSGPLALLPLWEGTSSIVWSTNAAHAAHLAGLEPAAFLAELNAALGGPGQAWGGNPLSAAHAGVEAEHGTFGAPRAHAPLGAVWGALASAADAVSTTLVAAATATEAWAPPPHATALLSPRASFPLRLQGAAALSAPGLAVIGDAAHTMHPLAGQNLNAGMADATALTAALAEGAAAGRAVDSPMSLARFAGPRAAANAATMLALDGVKRLYAAPPSPLSWLRNVGMAGIHALPPLKDAIAGLAAGKDGADAMAALAAASPAMAQAAAAVRASPPLQQAASLLRNAQEVGAVAAGALGQAARGQR